MWFCFFTPIVSHYEVDNAFGLPYIGLHALCLYGGLGCFIICSYPTYYLFFTGNHKARHNGAENALMYAMIIAFVGSGLRLFSYFNYNENGTIAWYAAGQLLLSIALAITFVITVLVSKFLWRDLFTLIDTWGAIPIGFVISFLVTYAVYTDSDRFFTKADKAATKNFWIMVVQALIIFGLFIYFWIRKCVKNDDEEEYPEQHESEFFNDDNKSNETVFSRII